jgi:hypothetical protein
MVEKGHVRLGGGWMTLQVVVEGAGSDRVGLSGYDQQLDRLATGKEWREGRQENKWKNKEAHKGKGE